MLALFRPSSFSPTPRLTYFLHKTTFATRSHSELFSAVKKVALMHFLRFPVLAQNFAKASNSLIAQGGLSATLTRKLIAPLTSTFSVGTTVNQAVNTAITFNNKGQQLLLDYVEEMLGTQELRQAAFLEIIQLLEALKDKPLKFVPLKITALMDHTLIEKKAQGTPLTEAEQHLFDTELSNVFQIVTIASQHGKTVFIDQEYPHQKKAIFTIMLDLMRAFNKERPVVYATIQASDRDCFDLYRAIMNDSLIPHPAIKLVNGAYVKWAHQHGFGNCMQPSKMHSFTALTLLAKAYLKEKKGPLYLGSHNPALIMLADKTASEENVSHLNYAKGQLYGFTTQPKPETLYVIFGPPTSCIDYALRRVVEGAGSHSAAKAPLLSPMELHVIANTSGVGQSLSVPEMDTIKLATTLNLQKIRAQMAVSSFRELKKS